MDFSAGVVYSNDVKLLLDTRIWSYKCVFFRVSYKGLNFGDIKMNITEIQPLLWFGLIGLALIIITGFKED